MYLLKVSSWDLFTAQSCAHLLKSKSHCVNGAYSQESVIGLHHQLKAISNIFEVYVSSYV